MSSQIPVQSSPSTSLADAAGAAIMVTDLNGAITYWNPESEKMFGWTAEQVLGRNVIDVTPAGGTISRAEEIMDELLRGKKWSGEFLLRRKDGTTFPAIVTDSPLYGPGGALVGVVGVSVDISERRRSEALLRSESKLRTIVMRVASSLVNIPVANPDRVIGEALHEVGTFFGADRAYVFAYDRVKATATNSHEWCRPGILPGISELQDIPLSQFEHMMKRHVKGEAFVVPDVAAMPEDDPIRNFQMNQEVRSFVVLPMMDEQQCVGSVGFDWVLDLRSFSATEIELLTVLAGLFAGAEMRRQDHNAVQSLLQEKETLLREVHHRVKNNLATISGLLSLQGENSDKPEVEQALTVIQGQVNAMWRVYERLFHSANFDSVDLRDFLLDFADDLAVAYRSMSDRVELQTGVESVVVDTGISIPIGLLVNELVTNSFKHAFPGDNRGTIRIDTTRHQDGTVELTVSDNGIGMPEPVDLAHSTGFGLRLVESQVKQIRGSIVIRRARGTEVHIRFPVSPG